MAGKATRIHRTDMRNALINLCTSSRQPQMRQQIVALHDLGIRDLRQVLISRESIGFIDEMCIEKGIVGPPVIFQTKQDKQADRTSVVGAGETLHEKVLHWIVGEFHFGVLCMIHICAHHLPLLQRTCLT